MDGTLQTTTRRRTERFRLDGTGSLSQGRLLVELYERLLRDLDDASAAIDHRERERAHRLLLHAQEILEALDQALDAERWEAAAGLSAVYRYALADLVRANIARDAAAIRACRELLAPLADAFRDAWQATTTAVPTDAATADGTAPDRPPAAVDATVPTAELRPVLDVAG